MKEAAKDPQIKLFGRKILLPDTAGEPSADSSDETNGGSSDCDRTSELSGGEKVEEKQLQPEEESQNPGMVSEPDQSSEMNLSDKNLKATSVDEDGASENQTTDGENGQQKTLKKPDKILPCPRCNSMETKFCYYNNYNVNQPRHFCKSCQRYWTAGGTMRNVPVGAGRRKNKNSSSHCHHITISDALQATGIDSPIGFHHPAFEPNGSVLSFGANSLLCVPDKRVSNGVTNGHYESDRGDTAACKNRGDDLMGSSVVAKNSTTDGSKIGAPNINAFQSPLANIPTAPWAIPWNSAVALPAIYPIPVFPAAYWNCGLPNGWNVPWLSIPSPTANQNSSPNSPLGKHSRNGELLNLSCSKHEQQHTEPKSSENSIVIPKTLRIDDPKEAAKSSIWETLGIKYDSAAQGGLFKALQPKGNEKNLPTSPSPVLHANPAALSRSINFHEGA